MLRRTNVVLLLVLTSLGCDAHLSGGDAVAEDVGLDAADATTADARDAASDAAVPLDTGADAVESDSGVDTGPCAGGCGANQVCLMNACACSSGFSPGPDGPCVPDDASDPTLHTPEEVCRRSLESRGSGESGFTTSDTMCDPGVVTTEAIEEGMERINFFRWLSGLGPASSAASHVQAQGCSLVSAWNPAGPAAHFPEPGAVCYTSEGAAGAGSSNIAWGSPTTVAAIDQWVEDRGNETTMGHRRWILNPPLSNVQLGLYRGGTSFGGASCMVVFGRSGTGRTPEWFAYPPPGVSPVDLPATTWTFHARWSFSDVTVRVVRVGDGMEMPVTILPLSVSPSGYPNATSFRPDGWARDVGETYRVTIVAGENMASYDVMPVGC